MITMDLKGITWVGHVYQKFEAMCLEVEEVMYQDTVKYVENQVQTVGASVKKFYSDVMQDVLLPSTYEPVKTVAASDLPVEKCAKTLNKPNIDLKEDTGEGDGEQLTKDSEVIADVNENSAHVPLSYQIQHKVDNIIESCSGSSMERASSDLLPREHKNSIALNKSHVENSTMAETSSEAACIGDEFSRMSSFCGNADAIHQVSCHQMPETLTPVSVEEDDPDSKEEGCYEIESATDSMTLTDGLYLIESIEKKEMEMRSSSSIIGSAESNSTCSNAGIVSFSCSVNGDIQHSEFPGQSKDWTVDTSESSTIGRKEIGSIQHLDKTRVDESCIMVNGAELHFHLQQESKNKPYKKKIRDAISSRMRLGRKKEYKQLALWYGDDIKSDHDCEESSREGTRRSLTHDVMDSEWELL